jgi:hypothetical protein
VDEPAVAVIVTDVAWVVCQLSVTLWPTVIELPVVEKTSVGVAVGGGVGVGGGVVFWLEAPEQEQRVHNAIGASPKAIKRKLIFFIVVCEQQRIACNVRDF